MTPPSAFPPAGMPPTAQPLGMPPPGLPPSAPPGPPLGPGGTVYQRTGGQNNLLGWLALALGVIGLCFCCGSIFPVVRWIPLLAGIPALVLGFLHLQRVKKGQASMSWLGWVGIVLGAIAVISAICGLSIGGWQEPVYQEFCDQNPDQC